MLLLFSIRVPERTPVWKELFIGYSARVFRGRLSNVICVLLSLLVLRVGCRM